MSSNYEEFKNTDEWNKIDNALKDLESNQDIELMTTRENVIGYLCKRLKS